MSRGEFFKRATILFGANRVEETEDFAEYSYYYRHMNGFLHPVSLTDEHGTEAGLMASITRAEVAVIVAALIRGSAGAPEALTASVIDDSITDCDSLDKTLDLICVYYSVKYNTMFVADGKFRPFEGVTMDDWLHIRNRILELYGRR